MKTIFTQTGHVAVQVLLVAIPFVLSAGFSWEKLTVGGILSAIYAYLVKKSAVASAFRAGASASFAGGSSLSA